MSNDICEELIVEIFSRLPSKSLLRFRSLSKQLCDCIHSPSFIRLHTVRLRSPKKFMIIHKDWNENVKNMYTIHSEDQLPYRDQLPYIGITPVKYPFRYYYTIVGSCNGILCLHTHGYDDIILWNPSIRRKVIVQYPPNYSDHTWFAFGFGFDPMVEDYKILWISKQQTTYVYTLKRGTWREISSPTPPFSSMTSYQCLFNGALHCVAVRDSFNYSCHIIKFDLSSEVFSTIELPEPSWKTSLVTTIDNRLTVVSSKYDDTRVWVMRDCNSWSLAFNLNTNPFKGANRVLQVTTSDDLLMHTPYRSIRVYNPKTCMQSTLVDLNDSSRPFSVTMFVESLGLLDTWTPC